MSRRYNMSLGLCTLFKCARSSSARRRLIWLLSDIASFFRGIFLGMVTVLSDAFDQFSGFGQCISFTSVAQVNFNIFNFFSIWNSSFLFLIPDIGNKCGSIFGVVTRKLLVYQELNAFKLTGVVYCSHTFLMILDNIHFLLISSTSSSHWHSFILQI